MKEYPYIKEDNLLDPIVLENGFTIFMISSVTSVNEWWDKEGGNNMSYLVAKRYNKRGCIAIKIDPSWELAQRVADLGWKYFEKDIEIFTLSLQENWSVASVVQSFLWKLEFGKKW